MTMLWLGDDDGKPVQAPHEWHAININWGCLLCLASGLVVLVGLVMLALRLMGW